MVSMHLEVSEANTVAHDDPVCALTISNGSTRVVEIPNMDLADDWPRFRVVDLGAQRSHEFTPGDARRRLHLPAMPYHDDDRPTLALEPGAARTWQFNLSWVTPLPEPGDHRLSASICVAREDVTSNEVTLHVSPSAPLHRHLAHAHAGFDSSLYLAWVADGDPAHLHLRCLRIGNTLQQVQALPLTPCSRAAQPVLSAAQNLAASSSRTVAWLDDSELAAIEVDALQISRPERRLSLPPGAHTIVAPLCKDGETGVTTATLWSERPDGSRFSVITIAADIEPRLEVEQTFAVPRWSRNVCSSTRDQWTVCLSEEGEELVLRVMTWDHERPGPFVAISRWPWQLIGAAVGIDSDDVIRGVVLGRERDAGVVMVGEWRTDTSGTRVSSAWVWRELGDSPLQLDDLQADVAGAPHVLLRDGDDWIYRRPGLRRVFTTPPGASPERPLLTLLSGGTAATLVWHHPSLGAVLQAVDDPRIWSTSQPLETSYTHDLEPQR